MKIHLKIFAHKIIFCRLFTFISNEKLIELTYYKFDKFSNLIYSKKEVFKKHILFHVKLFFFFLLRSPRHFVCQQLERLKSLNWALSSSRIRVDQGAIRCMVLLNASGITSSLPTRFTARDIEWIFVSPLRYRYWHSITITTCEFFMENRKT